MRTGDEAHGRKLMRAGVDVLRGRPFYTPAGGQGWSRAQALSLLGDHDASIAALKEGVDAGYYLELTDMDTQPLAAGLRADPRYRAILAPARLRLARTIADMRKAGLL